MFKGKKILVVDDEVDLREILRDEFLAEDAEVDEAKNGKEALEKCKIKSYDVVLSDIRMPGGDGVTLAKELRRINASKPIVFLITGFADLKNYEAYDLGAEGFITKPFHLDAVRDAVVKISQDPLVRWGQPLGMEPANKIVYKESLSIAVSHGLVHLGRGGFFLKRKPHGLRTSEIIRVQFHKGHMDGIIRWLRGDENPALPAGYGIETLSATDEIIMEVKNFLQPEIQRAFIPQS